MNINKLLKMVRHNTLFNYTLGILLVFGSITLKAQEAPKDMRLSISYFGHTGIYPGAKIGFDMTLTKWEKEKLKNNNTSIISNSLYVGPRVAVFSKKNYYTNYLPGVEVGFIRQSSNKKMYMAYGINLAYLNSYTVMGFNVDLSGEITDKQRESRSFFYQGAYFELGGVLSSNINWFTKFSIGTQLSNQYERTELFFTELGISYKLNNHE